MPGTTDESQDWKLQTVCGFVDSGTKRMLALLLFAMKVTFGLDGSSESISTFATKVNSILESKPSRFTTSKDLFASTEKEPIFEIKAWMNYMEISSRWLRRRWDQADAYCLATLFYENVPIVP